MTVQLPPPGRLYSVRAVIPGPAAPEAVDELSRRLSAKASEGLRRGVSGMTLDFAPDGGAVALTARVNDWNAGSAAMRIASLLIVKAGAEWDTVGMSVSSEPARSRPDIIDQGQTTTNAA